MSASWFSMSRVAGLGALVLSSSALASCGGAQQRMLGRPVHQQVAIVVRISDEVNHADEAGGVATLVETIEAGLNDHGMRSEVYTAPDDHPSPPRIELEVLFWSERSTTSRQLEGAAMALAPLGIVGLLVGPSNRMVVDCQVFFSKGAKPDSKRRFDVGGGLHLGGPDEVAAGSRAGSQILAALFSER